MTSEIRFYAVRTIRSGQVEALRALGEEATAYFKENQPGTLEYEWFLDSGAMTCHLFERYADADACLEHLRAWGEKFASRADTLLVPKTMFVYGPVNEDIRCALADANPAYCQQLCGYSAS
ncbi:MAG: antibiotic biosynthesis monooxygenase [Marivivens sp.]|nr:antibiotic biosynthesis monooxygenase [Marivivens sp.]